jgi:hypothetical protein
VQLNAEAARCAPMERGHGRDAPGPKDIGTDVAGSADGDRTLDPDRAQTRTTPMLVAVSPSPAAVDDGGAQGPAEESTGTTSAMCSQASALAISERRVRRANANRQNLRPGSRLPLPHPTRPGHC